MMLELSSYFARPIVQYSLYRFTLPQSTEHAAVETGISPGTPDRLSSYYFTPSGTAAAWWRGVCMPLPNAPRAGLLDYPRSNI
ncbi:hypothetical protein TgHK011_008201 [Trichoderma gracile]|nr:hypothetical protein TgHK011_008201 [Trichoderma gracile]